VFILLEFQSPSRRIFIGSHSLPPSLVRRIGPSAASLPHLPRRLSQAKGSLALIPLVGSSHIEGGVEYGTCFASSKKNENLNLSTGVAHTKKVLPYF
jgi:hypothetical protein